jgi:RNA polymerase sigma-70 factor, ECF subfamily
VATSVRGGSDADFRTRHPLDMHYRGQTRFIPESARWNKRVVTSVLVLMPAISHAMSSRPDSHRTARFEACFLPHLDAAWNLARWLARDDADAEDVVQESLLRALRYFDSFNGENPRTWLLAIVRNTTYTLKSQKPASGTQESLDEDIHVLVDSGPTPEALALIAADMNALQRCLERLPPALREVIVLRELENCSYKEIATITELKIGTVMSRLARARERLISELVREPQEASP